MLAIYSDMSFWSMMALRGSLALQSLMAASFSFLEKGLVLQRC
jgi:hypothetical protein